MPEPFINSNSTMTVITLADFYQLIKSSTSIKARHIDILSANSINFQSISHDVTQQYSPYEQVL